MMMVELFFLDLLIGDEWLFGVDVLVFDFWWFVLFDVMMNNVCGWLVEYFVWCVIGVEWLVCVEWDVFDVLWGDICIEVKFSVFV